MALVALSAFLSLILGSCVWLVLGDRFPLDAAPEDRWPVSNNICIYAAALVVPVYLFIFFVFG